ncbi:universal stress protein [Svornostia abyssi]|uniref:Universal stress protein n=1 Tax=Svornostia abyssi TaxID=2898438 RepID=A0ABY5PFM0_9ACTN|nr:universal stress protein [Parviterribacteraceae bacterium J379]
MSEDLADKPAMFALRTDAARILQLALDDHARTVVEDAVVLDVPELDVTRRWTRGAPGPAILEEIATQPYDLVILGALGYSAARRRFGSVTQQVLLASEVPVMVVPAQPAELVA